MKAKYKVGDVVIVNSAITGKDKRGFLHAWGTYRITGRLRPVPWIGRWCYEGRPIGGGQRAWIPYDEITRQARRTPKAKEYVWL